MSRSCQTHVSYAAILAITQQPPDPFRVGKLEFIASFIHTPSDHVHNLLDVSTDFHVTYWSDGQLIDGDELLVQDRVIICFGSLNWDASLQRLELKAQFVIPYVLSI